MKTMKFTLTGTWLYQQKLSLRLKVKDIINDLGINGTKYENLIGGSNQKVLPYKEFGNYLVKQFPEAEREEMLLQFARAFFTDVFGEPFLRSFVRRFREWE